MVHTSTVPRGTWSESGSRVMSHTKGCTRAAWSGGSASQRLRTSSTARGEKSQQYTIPPLLADDIRVLIYAGDADFICNWMGNKAWTLDLAWPGKSAFNASEAWKYDWIYGPEQFHNLGYDLSLFVDGEAIVALRQFDLSGVLSNTNMSA